MNSENNLVFIKLIVRINKARNVSVITKGDYGKTFKETGWGYDLLSEALSRAVEDRINFKEAKHLVQSYNSFNGMEKLAERLNGTFTIEEQDKNEYICFLTLEKKYFYSDEFLCEKRLLENTKSIKVLTKLANSKFDEIKEEVIRHPNTSFNILDKLSKNENSYISEKAKNSIKYKILELCKEEDKKNLIEKYAKTRNIEVNIIDILQNIVQKFQNENCFKNISSFAQLKINSLSDK